MSAWENYHLEWSPDPLSVTNPTWQDITSYALAPSGSAPIIIPGITGSTGASDNGNRMTVSLDNSDHRFTFGNTSSPLSPNWKPGRRIRCYETIAGKRIDLFTGFIQPPETDDWAEKGTDQYMTVSAIDRLGRLGTSRPMLSTLGEYILFNAGPQLLGYYPLLDAGPTAKPAAQSTMRDVLTLARSTGAPDGPSSLANFASATPIPGDDLPGMTFSPVEDPNNPGSLLYSARLVATLTNPITISGTDTLTLACWVYPRRLYSGAVLVPFQLSGAGNQLPLALIEESGSVRGSWGGGSYLSGTSLVDPIGSLPFALNQWSFVAVRVRLSPNVQEIYYNTGSASAAASGSPPASMTFSSITVLGGLDGYIAHVQIYRTFGSSDYGFAQHVAQYQAGLTGLANQTTGQRIATLAQYGGVPATDLGYVDPGIATMRVAALAGKTPLAAMREAETTEQGRLRTNGQGLLVFDPRTRRYNS